MSRNEQERGGSSSCTGQRGVSLRILDRRAPSLSLLGATRCAREATLDAISNAECRRCCWGDVVMEGMLCARTLLLDSCNGDSGGPLWATQDGVPLQVGLVSFGTTPCPSHSKPGVYTIVAHYVRPGYIWIIERLRCTASFDGGGAWRCPANRPSCVGFVAGI
eukprot:4926635-Prymnesium_polylepis.1